MNRKAIALTVSAVVLVVVGGFFSFNVLNAEPGSGGGDYCAKPQEGKMVVMHDGTAMDADITLNNGTQIKTDGTVIMKDGSQMMLEENECINKDGLLAPGTDQSDMQKQESSKVPNPDEPNDSINANGPEH